MDSKFANGESENNESEDDDNEDKYEVVQEEETNSDELRELQEKSLIPKIHKTVKVFRLSPTKNNDNFVKNVEKKFGKEIGLILHVKTRWNSLLAMLDRFSLLQNCVRKSLIALKSDMSFTEAELELLSEIILALQPLKVAVETLCSENINLYVADLTLQFMLNELKSQKTFLSK